MSRSPFFFSEGPNSVSRLPTIHWHHTCTCTANLELGDIAWILRREARFPTMERLPCAHDRVWRIFLTEIAGEATYRFTAGYEMPDQNRREVTRPLERLIVFRCASKVHFFPDNWGVASGRHFVVNRNTKSASTLEHAIRAGHHVRRPHLTAYRCVSFFHL